MLNITFSKAKEADACVESYKKLAKGLGGITKYGENTPIPLTKVLDICGLDDTIWAFRCTIETSENTLIEFACLCAEHVLHFYEDKYPDDKRPRHAIEATRICISDKSPTAKAARAASWAAAWAATWAARAAAEDAAWAAARTVTWAAAWDAASAAEIEWQTKMLRELLEK
jgi:hypothetical protein